MQLSLFCSVVNELIDIGWKHLVSAQTCLHTCRRSKHVWDFDNKKSKHVQTWTRRSTVDQPGPGNSPISVLDGLSGPTLSPDHDKNYQVAILWFWCHKRSHPIRWHRLRKPSSRRRSGAKRSVTRHDDPQVRLVSFWSWNLTSFVDSFVVHHLCYEDLIFVVLMRVCCLMYWISFGRSSHFIIALVVVLC